MKIHLTNGFYLVIRPAGLGARTWILGTIDRGQAPSLSGYMFRKRNDYNVALYKLAHASLSSGLSQSSFKIDSLSRAASALRIFVVMFDHLAIIVYLQCLNQNRINLGAGIKHGLPVSDCPERAKHL